MAARRGSKPVEPSQLDRDANEFGVGVRCGGWRLGLLVARNVEPGTAGRPPTESATSSQLTKVSMNQFAELARVSRKHVQDYYKAWEFAAKAKLVPAAESIKAGDDDICIDVDAIEDEENPHTHWSHFYQLAKTPPKPVEKKEDSVDEEIDEDFGTTVADDSATEDEETEADSTLIRNELLELLESTKALAAKLSMVGIVPPEECDLLSQIADAALDLNSTANALAVKQEAA